MISVHFLSLSVSPLLSLQISNVPQCFREVYRVLKPGGTFLICNESNGDSDKDEKWTEIIGGMTIYKDVELKAYLEQAGFHDVQIHKKKSWLCVTARK